MATTAFFHHLLLRLHRLDKAYQCPEPLHDPGGGFLQKALPWASRPPLAGDVDPVRGEEAAPHRPEALAFAYNLLALSREGPFALLLPGRHAAGVDLPGQPLLPGNKAKQPVKSHLLDRLRSGPVNVPGDLKPLSMGIIPQLDRRLQFGRIWLFFGVHGSSGSRFGPL